jgi:hypothetical protein
MLFQHWIYDRFPRRQAPKVRRYPTDPDIPSVLMAALQLCIEEAICDLKGLPLRNQPEAETAS